jgi:hypothetical protein
MGGIYGQSGVQSPQRQIALLSLRKTGAGTPVLSGLCAAFCTVVDNGVGDYTININNQRPFANGVQGVAMAHAPGFVHLDLANTSKLKISVNCFDVDGTTPAELDFDMLVMGSFASDLVGP